MSLTTEESRCMREAPWNPPSPNIPIAFPWPIIISHHQENIEAFWELFLKASLAAKTTHSQSVQTFSIK